MRRRLRNRRDHRSGRQLVLQHLAEDHPVALEHLADAVPRDLLLVQRVPRLRSARGCVNQFPEPGRAACQRSNRRLRARVRARGVSSARNPLAIPGAPREGVVGDHPLPREVPQARGNARDDSRRDPVRGRRARGPRGPRTSNRPPAAGTAARRPLPRPGLRGRARRPGRSRRRSSVAAPQPEQAGLGKEAVQPPRGVPLQARGKTSSSHRCAGRGEPKASPMRPSCLRRRSPRPAALAAGRRRAAAASTGRERTAAAPAPGRSAAGFRGSPGRRAGAARSPPASRSSTTCSSSARSSRSESSRFAGHAEHPRDERRLDRPVEAQPLRDECLPRLLVRALEASPQARQDLRARPRRGSRRRRTPARRSSPRRSASSSCRGEGRGRARTPRGAPPTPPRGSSTRSFTQSRSSRASRGA